MGLRFCTLRRGNGLWTGTSACSSNLPPDLRTWRTCGELRPSGKVISQVLIGKPWATNYSLSYQTKKRAKDKDKEKPTFKGCGTRWRLVEVDLHTSFSRSALSSRAWKQRLLHCELFPSGVCDQTVFRLELRYQESPSQLKRSPSGKALQPVT